jgi:hypothetical protein
MGKNEYVETQMKKSEFLENLDKDHQAWEATLARVHQDEMTEPLLPEGWSVIDIIAHVAWHEREMVRIMEANALVGSEWWDLPLDERNSLIYEQHKEMSFDEVMAWAKKEYARFTKAFDALSEEALNDPSFFENMPPEWKPWEIIADNTYEHYRNHINDIEKWLAEKEK